MRAERQGIGREVSRHGVLARLVARLSVREMTRCRRDRDGRRRHRSATGLALQAKPDRARGNARICRGSCPSGSADERNVDPLARPHAERCCSSTMRGARLSHDVSHAQSRRNGRSTPGQRPARYLDSVVGCRPPGCAPPAPVPGCPFPSKLRQLTRANPGYLRQTVRSQRIFLVPGLWPEVPRRGWRWRFLSRSCWVSAAVEGHEASSPPRQRGCRYRDSQRRFAATVHNRDHPPGEEDLLTRHTQSRKIH
jgi:hypothetical protein